MGFFDKIKKIGIFGGHTELNDDFYEQLEEDLILADLGAENAMEAVEELQKRAREQKLKTAEDARNLLVELLTEYLDVGSPELKLQSCPSVLLFVGVNGAGKTTTIGKLAHRMSRDGKKVLLAAGDTFRAAAAEQLTIWAERAGADIVKQNEGADSATVVFDALEAAKARKTDIVMIDTAGRLQNKKNLMNELNKVSRVIDRVLPDCDRETLLVLDATTGQNGLQQSREFGKSCGITGIVLTKMDGTAKGGIAVAIAREMQIPVKFIGIGESIEDLVPFDAHAYAEALI